MTGNGFPIIGPGEVDRRVIAVAPGDVEPGQRGQFDALVAKIGQLAPPLIIDPNSGEPTIGLRAYDPETQDTLGTLERGQLMGLLDEAGMPEDEQGNTWNVMKLASARVAEQVQTWQAHDTIGQETAIIKKAIFQRQEGDLTSAGLQEVLTEEGPVMARARDTVVDAAHKRSSIPAQRPGQEPFMFVWDEDLVEYRPLMTDDVSNSDLDVVMHLDGFYRNLAQAGGHRELSGERLVSLVAALNSVIEDRIGPEAPRPAPL
jgi:hypothetical protein